MEIVLDCYIYIYIFYLTCFSCFVYFVSVSAMTFTHLWHPWVCLKSIFVSSEMFSHLRSYYQPAFLPTTNTGCMKYLILIGRKQQMAYWCWNAKVTQPDNTSNNISIRRKELRLYSWLLFIVNPLPVDNVTKYWCQKTSVDNMKNIFFVIFIYFDSKKRLRIRQKMLKLAAALSDVFVFVCLFVSRLCGGSVPVRTGLEV